MFSRDLIMASSLYNTNNFSVFMQRLEMDLSEYGGSSPNWGFVEALFNAKDGDRLESYRVDLLGRLTGKPLLKKVDDVIFRVSPLYGLGDPIITGNGNRINFSGYGRYHFLTSTSGNRVFVDGSGMTTDYPDFLIANYGIGDSVKTAIERLAKRAIFKGISKCLSFSGGTIIDRYGNKYAYGSLGLNPGTSFASVGVGWASSDYRTRQHVMDEETLMQTITGPSIGLTGSFLGGGTGAVNPWTGAGTVVLSAGAQAGVGIEGTLVRWTDKDSSLSWDWAITQETSGPFAVQKSDLVSRIYY
jgi:hypothetical protein